MCSHIPHRALGKYHSQVSAKLWGHLAGQHISCSGEPFAETRVCKTRKATSVVECCLSLRCPGSVPAQWKSWQTRDVEVKAEVHGLSWPGKGFDSCLKEKSRLACSALPARCCRCVPGTPGGLGTPRTLPDLHPQPLLPEEGANQCRGAAGGFVLCPS